MPNSDTPHITINSMIFKTWLANLTKIQRVVNNLKSIETWSNGATRLLNPNVVNNLSSAINGLSLQQAQLSLSTRNLTQEQMNQVLVQAGLIASENQIQAELIQSALAQSGLSAEKQKAILSELGLMNVRTSEILTTKACTKEELLNMLATKGVTGANANAIISTLGLTGANGAATISFELLTASIWSNIKTFATWLATNPVGWCVLAATAIFGAVKAFDALTVSFDEGVEKTKSSKQELKQLTSEISDLNRELETTRNRIDELLEKANSGTISLLEEEELNNLQEQNDELQREIALKEKLAEIDAKEAAENAAYSLTYRTDDNIWDEEYNPTDRIEKLQKYVDSANYYKDKLSEINQQILDIEESATDDTYKNDSVYKDLIKQQEKYKDNLKNVEKQMSSTYKEISAEDDGLYYNGKIIEGHEDLAERLATVYMAVELYLNEGNVKNTTENYVEAIKNRLVESGLSEEISTAVAEGFSEEELDSIMNSGSIDWSECFGLDAADVIKNIKEQLASVVNTDAIQVLFSDKITTSQESLDKFQSSIKSASDAYTTLLSGNYSTSELINSIQTINQAVGDMGGSLNWEYINQSEDSLELLGNVIEHVSQKYAESILSGTGIDVNSDFGKMIANIIQETYEAEATFTGMNAQLDALQSSYQTLTGILESYNNTGYISLDNLQSLITADENLISMLEVENGQLVLNQEAYENLVAVQLLEFKEKLNNAAVAEIEALAKQKSAEATNSNAQASEDAVAKLDAETEAFNRNTSAAITNAVTKAEEEGVSEDEIQSVLDKYNEIWNAAVSNFDGDFDSFMGGTKSAGAAGSSAGNAYADAFEEELKELDDLHSNSFISEKEYLDRLRVLYERYFKDKLGYEKEFADYQKKYLDGYKSLYESVFSHASKVIGDRIDAINDEKDSAIDSLEAQKKAAEDSYNAQIKLLEDKKNALQSEIDKIKEANEDRKEAIDLQKAEYELARMQNQRTILQYSEDKGVHYVTDTSGIRDARNDLDDKKADAQIRALEKQQDALDKQIDAIQEMLDASDEYWDTQIEQTEKYYDAMIQGMEEYKSRWEELSDLQEQAEMAALLKELGYTEEDLADAGSGAFDRLRNSYLGILKDMNDGNQSVLDGLSRLANIDMSSIPSFLSTTQGYIDSIANMDVTALSDGLGNICDGFSNVADSAASAASAISGGTSSGNSNGNNPSGKGSANNNKNNANNGISLKDAITEVSTGSTQEINKISDAFAGENEEGTSVTSAIQKVMDKIGNSDSDNENTDSLMSTLTEQTDAALNEESGIPAQTNAWDELNTPLGESVDLVTTLQSTLEDMDGRTFTVTLNVAGNGSPNSIISEFSGGVSNSPGHGGGGKSRARVQGTANVDGTANAEGNWGVKKAGLSLVGELGQELWVHSKDGTFETVGDNGAEFIDIKPNDIIFNHLQTKQLLDKGNIIGRGKSYANGSASVNGTNSEGWITLSNGLQARPLQEGDTSWDLTQKFQPLADRILKGETDIMSNAMIEHQRQMEQMVRDITTMNVTTGNNSSVTIGDIHVTCPGVTSHEVAKQVGDELNNMFRGLHLDAMQQSMMR